MDKADEVAEAPKRKRTTQNAEPPKKRARASRNAVPSLTTIQEVNDDCLVLIFKLLDIITLMRMSKLNQRFKEIIIHRVIPFKTIDFSTFSKTHSVQKVLQAFGNSMTRIIVHDNDIQITRKKHTRFEELLRLLIDYSEPGKLKHLELDFGTFHKQSQLLNDVRPYFVNVHTLILHSKSFHNGGNGEFIREFPKQNLRTLELHNIDWVGNWLTAESLPNLQRLHICPNDTLNHFNADRFYGEHLTRFISSKPPSLVDFDCVGAFNDAPFDELSRSLPTIERLGEVECWPERRLNNQHFNNRFMDRFNNNNNGDDELVNYRAKWNYLNGFTNLTYLSLKSRARNFSDCGDAFRILARRNTIKELDLTFGKGSINKQSPVSAEDLRQLTNLKKLHLNGIDQKSTEFIDRLVTNLPALSKWTLSGGRLNQKVVVNMVQRGQHLRELVLKCKMVFSANLYKRLVKIRQASVPEGGVVVIHMEADKAAKCLNDLGKKYKPSIIAIKAN